MPIGRAKGRGAPMGEGVREQREQSGKKAHTRKRLAELHRGGRRVAGDLLDRLADVA